MKNHSFGGARLSINIVFQKENIAHYTQLLFDCSVVWLFQIPNADRKTCTALFLFCFVPTQKNHLFLYRALIFCFILVHPQVRQVRK